MAETTAVAEPSHVHASSGRVARIPAERCDDCGAALPQDGSRYERQRRFCGRQCREHWWATFRTRHQPRLPFSGRTPISRHTSYQAAVAKAPGRGAKKARLLEVLREHGPLTDAELSGLTGYPRQSICSLRGSLLESGQVVASGETRIGAFNLPNTVWMAREQG